MKQIKLTQGKDALVDDSDFIELNRFKWYTQRRGKNFYAIRNSLTLNGKRKTVRMHIEIMGETPKGVEIDHIDGNGLNNQRKNLRFCSKAQNAMNVGLRLDNRSGFKGVSWDKVTKKWKTQISIDKIQRYLGVFDTKEEAYEAYCVACLKFHGDFAKF